MAPRRWPTLCEWIALYLRLLMRRSPTLNQVARTAGLTDEKLLTQRKATKVEWVKPLQPFYETLPVPEFMAQFLDAAEKSCPPPPPLPTMPEPPAPRPPQQTPPNDSPAPPTPPQ